MLDDELIGQLLTFLMYYGIFHKSVFVCSSLSDTGSDNLPKGAKMFLVYFIHLF